MTITINKLRHDTCYFFSKQIVTIFFISIIVTFISIAIDMLIKPDAHIMSIINHKKFIDSNSLLNFINNMNTKEKYELLKYSMLKIIELLMSKTLLIGSMITLISNLSYNEKTSITCFIYSLFEFLPNLFILNFLLVFVTQISFMLFIIPGVFISILLSLSPIILSFKKNKIRNSMCISTCISWKYITIIGPGILFWISGKFLLTTILSNIDFINNNIIYVILNISINVLYSILIIYLFRFYMLFRLLKN